MEKSSTEVTLEFSGKTIRYRVESAEGEEPSLNRELVKSLSRLSDAQKAHGWHSSISGHQIVIKVRPTLSPRKRFVHEQVRNVFIRFGYELVQTTGG